MIYFRKLHVKPKTCSWKGLMWLVSSTIGSSFLGFKVHFMRSLSHGQPQQSWRLPRWAQRSQSGLPALVWKGTGHLHGKFLGYFLYIGKISYNLLWWIADQRHLNQLMASSDSNLLDTLRVSFQHLFTNHEATPLVSSKAFHLETGWQCKRICHLCTGDGWENPTDDAPWVHKGCGQSPYKTSCSPSPFLDVVGCNKPRYISLDYCHIFHLGYGLDMGASTVVLLAKLGHFGQGNMDVKLAEGFTRFNARLRHEFESLTMFQQYRQFYLICCLVFRSNTLRQPPVKLRAGDFPTSLGGKAFDTALVVAWLDSEMEKQSDAKICHRLFFWATQNPG